MAFKAMIGGEEGKKLQHILDTLTPRLRGGLLVRDPDGTPKYAKGKENFEAECKRQAARAAEEV